MEEVERRIMLYSEEPIAGVVEWLRFLEAIMR